MNDEQTTEKENETLIPADDFGAGQLEFDGSKLNPVSSFASSADAPNIGNIPLTLNDMLDPASGNAVNRTADVAEAVDPIFAELAAPLLPELPKENRAQLQMQSPTRLNFYWSFKQNPYQTLNRALSGNAGSYVLVVKLVDLKTDREEISPIEVEGSWWFDVNAGSVYRAEIGFYAVNRPFVRVFYSNTIETPRRSPSPRKAGSADWTVSANQFAKVLNVSGFPQDAYEVALAGDDDRQSEIATGNAFSELVGRQKGDLASDEIRTALLAIAAGYRLEHLREQIGARLYELLESNAGKLSAEKALASLQKNFGEFVDEIVVDEQIGAAVFGASSVNFPRRFKRRFVHKLPARLSPLSSFSLKH